MASAKEEGARSNRKQPRWLACWLAYLGSQQASARWGPATSERQRGGGELRWRGKEGEAGSNSSASVLKRASSERIGDALKGKPTCLCGLSGKSIDVGLPF